MAKRLFVFNPEHDMVLAGERQGGGMTPPKAARMLRCDLGFLPAFMAEDGDWVMVDDVEVARRSAEPFAEFLPDVRWVTAEEVKNMSVSEKKHISCHPWGWDEDVRNMLLRIGMTEWMMPTGNDLKQLRLLSHRASSITLLDDIVKTHPIAIGERKKVSGLDEVKMLTQRWKKAVVKAPWSSSGRGVRFVGETLSNNEEGFVRHVLQQQKSVIVEPYYDCLLNFAMEYSVKEYRTVPLDGISLFTNAGATYTGNLLVPEKEKQALLEKHVDALTMLDINYRIHRWLDSQTMDTSRYFSSFRRFFKGPVGVDMMLVRTADGIRIHPCVEVNFRCTMGHLALHVERRTKGKFHSMSIRYDNPHYSLVLNHS